MFDKKEKITLTVTGMSCGHCVKRVGDALKAVKGVKNAEVDLANGKAEIEFVSGKVTVGALIDAVEKCGFGASEA